VLCLADFNCIVLHFFSEVIMSFGVYFFNFSMYYENLLQNKENIYIHFFANEVLNKQATV